ncbi:concanavalin A-like lectin/glucanase [Gigaspora margarita]|uniref:Concanavalin A-like lectin/glucanase n=1 Tax=Gigaspora margarita TaxID=4874 RepID=A0A8H4B3Y9_GIGMA|nr:concanavalin A-like lectin/glucanase [Gigaspora margarita]
MVLIGRAKYSRTPALWSRSGDSAPCPRFSVTGIFDVGFDMSGYGILPNRWYHIAYTLSNPDKRMNFYIDGEWVGSFSITHIQGQSNDDPLYIGRNFGWYGFTGQISEVLMDYSGEDPTNNNDNGDNDEGPKKSFVDLTIGFFLGMMVLASGLFMHKIII